MRKKLLSLFFLVLVIFTVGVSIWGPETLSEHRDRSLLGKAHLVQVEMAGEGYRYKLSREEKLFILSQALKSQEYLESSPDIGGQTDYYQEPKGNYAFVPNHQEVWGNELSGEEIYDTCNQQLNHLKEAKILPETVQEIDPALYEAVLYSAIDVREPTNYVLVWKVGLSDALRGVSKENRLIEAYVDADDGKIYGFYARTQKEWEELEPDGMIKGWCRYLGLLEPEAYEESNPLAEATSFFRKYAVSGEEGEDTVVTVGFYEGIREIFIRITR